MNDIISYIKLNNNIYVKALLTNLNLIIIITLLFCMAGFVSSILKTPTYKSTVILLPSSSASISKSLLSNSSVIRENLLLYGEKEDGDRILQSLQSENLKNKIIEQFDLINHYKIDKTAKYPQTAISTIFNKKFEFKKAPYMGIEISVIDVDPKLAADMANYCAEMIDTIMNNLSKQRAIKSFSIVQNEFFSLEKSIRDIRDSLELLGSFGLTEYESQSQALNSEYARSLNSGNSNAIKIIEKKLKVIEKYGSKYMYFSQLLEFEIERYSMLKAKYAEAKVEAYENIPYKYVLDSAKPNEKKYAPNIILSVLISLFLGLISSVVIIFFKEFVLKKTVQ